MSDFASPTPFPRTRYTRPLHRAYLAPAGVEGPKATPTPFRSAAEAPGAPTHDKINESNLELKFGDPPGGAPQPADSIDGEKMTLDEGEFLAVFDKREYSTVNFAHDHHHGGQSVLDAVKSYLLTFLAHLIVPKKPYSVDAALRTGTATLVDFATKIIVNVSERRKTDDLAVMIDDITSLYLNVGSPSPSRTANMKPVDVNLSVKGMSDVLSKLTTSGGTIGFTSDHGVIADTPSPSYTDLSTVDCGGAVISSGSWA